MSDENTTATEEQPTNEVAPETKTFGEVKLHKETFRKGSDNEGFYFWYPEYLSLDGAAEHLSKKSQNGKDGKSIILGIVNAALATRMRSVANSKLVKTEDGVTERISDEDVAKLRSTNSILVSEQDALDYVPGERDGASSVSGLTKVCNDLKKAALKAKGEGNLGLAAEHAKKWKEKSEELKALIEAQRAKDDEALAEFVA